MNDICSSVLEYSSVLATTFDRHKRCKAFLYRILKDFSEFLHNFLSVLFFIMRPKRFPEKSSQELKLRLKTKHFSSKANVRPTLLLSSVRGSFGTETDIAKVFLLMIAQELSTF